MKDTLESKGQRMTRFPFLGEVQLAKTLRILRIMRPLDYPHTTATPPWWTI